MGQVDKRDSAEIEWRFTPTNYFEAPFQVDDKDCKLCFELGRVKATMDRDAYSGQETLTKLLAQIRCRFLAAQLVNQEQFSIDSPKVEIYDEAGKKARVFLVETARIKLKGYPADIVLTNAQGAVEKDSRAARIQARVRTASLAAEHAGDAPLQRMLEAYNNSVDDPANELVHLYEIRDVIAKQFGSGDSARKALNVTKADWNRLGAISNDLPVAEGRHRAKRIASYGEPRSLN